MRVLFLATRDWFNPQAAGGDIQMWEYARYLASRGHAVTFAASRFPGAPQEEVLDGVRVVRLGRILSLWFTTYLYYRRHGRGHYDVVVAEGFGGARIPRLSPLYVREPLMTEWHQIHRDLFASQYPRFLLPALNALEALTAHVHRNTFVRVGTTEWQQAFPSLGFHPERTFLVPVSIRDDWLNGAEPPGVAEPNVLWLGKFRRYKCPHHAIRAVRHLRDQGLWAHLTLAGRRDDRVYERELMKLVDQLGMIEQVTFSFNITEEEKRALLRRTRVLVLPSAVEGFGIVVLEANACGVPVVASSGVPESVVAHRRNGLRYPFGHVRMLAEALADVLRDDQLYLSLSKDSIALARGFRWSEVGRRYENALLQVVTTGVVEG